MDDSIEVTGLSAVLLPTPQGLPPIVWRPGGPEPEALRLILRYRRCEYLVVMARTMDGARTVLEEQTEEEWQTLARHMAMQPGWWVRLTGGSGQCGSHFTSAYPTVEAAIVAALTLPPLMLERQQRKNTRR